MIYDSSYKKAFFFAIAMHFALALFLLTDSTTKHAVLKAEKENVPGEIMPVEQPTPVKQEIVKAETVNSQEILETVKRLKEEKMQQQRAEQARQQALAKQALQARQARIAEQQRLAKLKEKAEKLAIARKKQIEEEQKRLKQLALQKELEAKRLEELKNKQQELERKQKEAEKIALKKKQEEERKAKETKIQAEKATAEKQAAEKDAQEKAAMLAKQADAEKAAALAAAQQARMSGEVDKYKALIENAISRNWILPENADRSLSCQFHIRLAPDGSVLEVSLTRSSGDPILDRSAQAAIFKASPLPVPSDPVLFSQFRDNKLTVRPTNVRG